MGLVFGGLERGVFFGGGLFRCRFGLGGEVGAGRGPWAFLSVFVGVVLGTGEGIWSFLCFC